MRKWIAMTTFMVASMGMMQGTAHAWHVIGTFYCDANLNGVIDSGDLPVSGLTVTVTGVGNSFTGSYVSGELYGAGTWVVALPDTPGTYKVSVAGNTSPIISPTTMTFSLTNENFATRF